ncbi:replication initiator protein A [Enterococcus sp. DIV1420a]|uniref:replication initiator protein A n=1 Tax=Enterococcus sp. DIV1420a TaxID=2774672 RepID=UPI003F225A3E
MSEFNFFKVDRVYRELYYQFPEVFITSDKYATMSDSTKIAYMLLKARLEFSINKNQVDEEGNVYFIYTVNELCEVLNCGNKKAIRIKKELENFGLLLQVDMGFNKKMGKRNANRLYLAELNVDENDIYLLRQFDEKNARNVDISEGVKSTPSPEEKKPMETSDRTEGVKMTPSENVGMNDDVKITQELDNPVLNTKKIDTKEIDTPADHLFSGCEEREQIDLEKMYEQDRLLRENFAQTYAQTFFTGRALKQMAIFSPSIEAAVEMIDIAYQAKRKVESRRNAALQKEGDQPFRFGILADSFKNALADCVIRFLSKESINRNKEKPYRNRSSVWYTTVETFWEACMLTQESLSDRHAFPYGEQADLLPDIENMLRKDKQKNKQAVQQQIYSRKKTNGVTISMHDWLHEGSE